MKESKLKVLPVCTQELLEKATPCLCNHSLWESPEHFFVLLFCTLRQFSVTLKTCSKKSTIAPPEEFSGYVLRKVYTLNMLHLMLLSELLCLELGKCGCAVYHISGARLCLLTTHM